jgi:hypothetical protein
MILKRNSKLVNKSHVAKVSLAEAGHLSLELAGSEENSLLISIMLPGCQQSRGYFAIVNNRIINNRLWLAQDTDSFLALFNLTEYSKSLQSFLFQITSYQLSIVMNIQTRV